MTILSVAPMTTSKDGREARRATIRSVCLISRQRIVGETNGSSTYVLSIVRYLRSKGLDVHYVCPSPVVFGRWPFFVLRPEMTAFSSYRIRGALKLGKLVVNPDLRVWGAALVAVIDVVSARLGLPLPKLGKPARHSLLTPEPLSPADRRYLGVVAAPLADAILCDYASLTEAIADVGRHDARSAVIMHDLFSSRFPQISAQTEMEALGRADLVIAIQAEEAAAVAARLPLQSIVVAPVACTPVLKPVVGRSDELLFVGSNTAPNVEALNWFADEVWPLVVAARPSLVLNVAGTVSRGMGPLPKGIRLLGLVPDLNALYDTVGCVISPLRSGTGLKIKLIEALSRGKAVVATPVTVEGVESTVSPAVRVADTPNEFAAAILDLVGDEDERMRRGQAAIDIVASRFDADTCYAPIVRFLRGEDDQGNRTGHTSPSY